MIIREFAGKLSMVAACAGRPIMGCTPGFWISAAAAVPVSRTTPGHLWAFDRDGV